MTQRSGEGNDASQIDRRPGERGVHWGGTETHGDDADPAQSCPGEADVADSWRWLPKCSYCERTDVKAPGDICLQYGDKPSNQLVFEGLNAQDPFSTPPGVAPESGESQGWYQFPFPVTGVDGGSASPQIQNPPPSGQKLLGRRLRNYSRILLDPGATNLYFQWPKYCRVSI